MINGWGRGVGIISGGAYNRTKNRAGFKTKKTKVAEKLGRGAYKWKFTVLGFLLSQHFELINSVIPLH